MDIRRIKTACLISVLSLMVCPQALSAQKWSPQQKEVWSAVVDWDNAWAKGDAAGFLRHFHKDVVRWAPNEGAPVGKAEMAGNIEYSLSAAAPVRNQVTPIRILVKGNVAIVCYYFQGHIKLHADGKVTRYGGRRMATFIKEDGKWLVIAITGQNADED